MRFFSIRNYWKIFIFRKVTVDLLPLAENFDATFGKYKNSKFQKSLFRKFSNFQNFRSQKKVFFFYYIFLKTFDFDGFKKITFSKKKLRSEILKIQMFSEKVIFEILKILRFYILRTWSGVDVWRRYVDATLIVLSSSVKVTGRDVHTCTAS